MACDIQNAYLTANRREKIWTYAGPEFGSERGTPMIIKKALYGLKSSGAAFQVHLAETLHDIGFKSSKADPDVWLRPAINPTGEHYYEYILCNVDDILAISHDSASVLKAVQVNFRFKDDKIAPPETYLGVQLGQMEIKENVRWYMSSENYVRAVITNIEEKLSKLGQKLPNKCKTPLSSGYRLELDVMQELKADGLHRSKESCA